MISPKDSHFLDHFSPQEDDELPPLESVEPEPVLGGGTFLMGIYGYGMEMLWKTHHLLDIFFGISFGMFFFGIFLGYGKHILQRIYIFFPACVWSIFSWNIHHDSPGKSSIRWSGNSMVGASQKRSGNAELKTYSYFKTMLYMIWTCCSLEKTWMASPMTCVLVEFDAISLAGYGQTNGTTHSTLAITGTGRESDLHFWGSKTTATKRGCILW